MSTSGVHVRNRHLRLGTGAAGATTRSTHGSAGFDPSTSGSYYDSRFDSEPLAMPEIPAGVIDAATHVMPGSISDLALFAQSIRPVAIVAALPSLPDTNYPIGSTLVLTTDGRLYRNVANAWTAAVSSSSGGIEILGALPGLPSALYPPGSVVFLTTDDKLYRNDDDAWSTAADGADLIASSVTANAILAGTITGAKIAANTITAANIAANTITAAEIAADTITAAQIAAGAIATSELAVGFSMSSGNVVVSAGGITINNGVLTINDQFGSNVMTGAGFGSSWLDFISEGFYNGHFGVGTTTNITAATEVSGGDSNADYLASLSADIPYWVVLAETGAGTFGRVADATAVGTFALQWSGTEDATIYQDVPVLAGRRSTVFMSWRWTNSSSGFTREVSYQFRDSTHGPIGTEIDAGLGFTDTQATYIEEYVARSSSAPANARFLRVSIRFARTSGSPTVWLNAVRIQQDMSGVLFIRSVGSSISGLGIFDDQAGGFLNLGLNADSFPRVSLSSSLPSIRFGPGGATDVDVFIHRPSAKALQIDSDSTGTPLKVVVIPGALLRVGGTSFPASPTTGDQYFRTDHAIWYFFNGTIWLSVHQYSENIAYFTSLAATADDSSHRLPGTVNNNMLLQAFELTFYINGGTALSGSHYWSIALKSFVANTPTTQLTNTINSGVSGNWRSMGVTGGISLSGIDMFQATATMVGTPGTLTTHGRMIYRKVAT